MDKLMHNDLRFAVSRLPKDLRDLLTLHSRKLFVGGGYIRAIIAGEPVSDIDLFGGDAEWLRQVATGFAAQREGSKLHRTHNAVTLLCPGRTTVQFITRWTFATPEALIASFDFTICQAALWRDGNDADSPWASSCAEAFYIDLSARRLVYTHPVRNEDAGGSLMRALKYIKRGYSIQVQALGGVVARLVAGVRDFDTMSEQRRTIVLSGLLREVDPLIAIDGFEVVDEHAKVPGFEEVQEEEQV